MAGRQPGIRDAIQLLSSILATNCGIDKIPSESFRLAKFDRAEVVETFQHLLSHLTQLNESLDSHQEGEVGRNQTKTNLENSYDLLTVRKYLFALGYHRLAFFSDYGGGSSSSRELLLATIWMLHKSNLLSKLISYHTKMAARRVVPVSGQEQVLVDAEKEEAGHVARELEALTQEPTSLADMERLRDGVQKLVWLRGKLCAKWRMSLNAQHAFQRMAHSLSQHTASPQLNVHELYLLRHPAQLDVYLDELEWHVAALHSLAEWARHEEVFWKWGESVLDLQDRESTLDLQDKEVEQVETDKNLHAMEELSHEVQQLDKEVRGLLEKNAHHVSHIHRVWAKKYRRVSVQELRCEQDKLSDRFGGRLQLAASPCGPLELTLSDCPVYVPLLGPGSAAEASHQVANGGQETLLRTAPDVKLTQTLRQLEEALQQLKGEVVLQLDEVERQQTPASTYRIAPRLKHLSKMHK